MTNKEDSATFYARFEARLNEINKYPIDYSYKFIVPGEGVGKQQVQQIIAQYDLTFTTKNSKNGKYISYTAKLKAQSSDQIVEIYRAVSHVEKVIML